MGFDGRSTLGRGWRERERDGVAPMQEELAIAASPQGEEEQS